MSLLDWLIVIIPIALLLGVAIYSKKYARNVTDYMAAGRVAGRYVMSVGDLTAGLSVITLVAGVEAGYQTGYGVSFWSNITAPLGIVLALTGFCTYRWRETRCLSRGQFLEMRYGSKFFRLVTAFIAISAEMITNAIGPAIAANFFIYYLKLPHQVMICGINLPCYIIIVALCLTLATILIWPSGRISLLITDCIQGILCYPVFVIIVGFLILKFSWGQDIVPVMLDRTPGQSYMNPYDIAQLRDFNLFSLVVSVTSTVMNRAAWFGNDTTNSGRTPHEQKMAGVLGSWRNGFSVVMILMLAILTIVFMTGRRFADRESCQFKITSNDVRRDLSVRVLKKLLDDPEQFRTAEAAVRALPDQFHVSGKDAPLSQQKNLDTLYFDKVRQVLGNTPEGRHAFQEFRTTYQQMMMPTVLNGIFPVGMLGIFCLLMVMLLISTDDSRIFNSAGTLVQDMILPCYTFFKKERLSPKRHLLILRLTTLAVTLFFFVVAIFFRNMDYIYMFTTIMCSFWLAGSGPVLVFGLYSRFGNLTGAWCSILFGSGTALAGLIGQRNWTKVIYPFLEEHGMVASCDRALRTLCAPFEPWLHWRMDAVKFPINSYEIFFFSMLFALAAYIIGSYLTYKPFDLDRLLHRGKYADEQSSVKPKTRWSWKTLLDNLLSITPEYTTGDKVIAWSVFIYSFIYRLGLTFLAVVICNLFFRWPEAWWGWYFYIVNLLIPGIVGIISTVWFMWGGIRDLKQLFRDLEKRTVDTQDNGQILMEGK